MMITSACALLIATGSSIMISMKLGAGKDTECEEIVSNSVLVSVLLQVLY